MNDKENMITTKIQGTDFIYNKDTHYEEDGHIYCKICNEKIELNKKKLLKQDRLRQSCFISKNQIAYTFKNADEDTDKEIIKKAKNYVKHFEEMRKDNVGLLLYGNVGSGKTYVACAIANAIITEYSHTVKMRNFAQILNDLQKGGFNLDRNEYIE